MYSPFAMPCAHIEPRLGLSEHFAPGLADMLPTFHVQSIAPVRPANIQRQFAPRLHDTCSIVRILAIAWMLWQHT